MRAGWEPYRLRGGRLLRRGYTTGTCAAAAARGATQLLFTGRAPETVAVITPAGWEVELEVKEPVLAGGEARCCVTKDAGDDPDVTHGLDICAVARALNTPGVAVRGGPGVGVVTRPGLGVGVGEAAINPVPLAMIRREAEKALPPGQGVEVTIIVPRGEEVASRTMNPRLGILGGISILGTTGVVEPMSEEAFRESLAPQVAVAAAEGFRQIVMTPGRKGEKLAVERYGLPPGAVVQISNFVGYMLEEAARQALEGVLLFGYHGKLAKVAAGVFHTHSRVADARLETLAAHAALLGADRPVVAEIMQAHVGEAAVEVLRQHGLMEVMPRIAAEASRRAEEYVGRRLRVGTVLLSRAGEALGWDRGAEEIGRVLGWKPPSI